MRFDPHKATLAGRMPGGLPQVEATRRTAATIIAFLAQRKAPWEELVPVNTNVPLAELAAALRWVGTNASAYPAVLTTAASDAAELSGQSLLDWVETIIPKIPQPRAVNVEIAPEIRTPKEVAA